MTEADARGTPQSGTIVLRIEGDPDGSVARVCDDIHDDVTDEVFTRCLLDGFRGIRLPEATEICGQVTLKYPLRLGGRPKQRAAMHDRKPDASPASIRPAMYLPKLFDEPREDAARDLIRSFPFATVVGAHPGGEVEIAHVPLLLSPDAPLRLAGHVARGNPFVALVAAGAPVTAVFHGPDAYVSAAWYESPREQVPTWNYAVVHVTGKLSPLTEDALEGQLAEMARTFEPQERAPWSPDLLEPSFFAGLRRGIVGFAIAVEHVRTKLKLSQNRSAADRARVVAALAASDRPRDREVASMMSAQGAERSRG